MYAGLLHSHHYLAYLALLLIFLAAIKSLVGFLQKQNYTKIDKQLALFAMILVHLQLTVGLVLYYKSPNVNFSQAMSEGYRFYTVEHIFAMILGIGLITIGYSQAKRATTSTDKHKKVALFYTLGLLLILSRIPWNELLN